MEKCRRKLEEIKDALIGKKNVVGVGVGYKKVGSMRTKQPSIIVFVEKKESKENLSRSELVPEKIDGVYLDVIEIGKVKFLDLRKVKKRPAQPGMSLGHYKVTAGTFGAVVKDKKTGEPLILSNNHILANATDGRDGRASKGDAIFQPAPYDGGTDKEKIAELLRFVPVYRSEKETECRVANSAAKIGNKLIQLVRPAYKIRFVKQYRGSNVIDAALARPLSPGLIKQDILEIGVPKGIAKATVGMRVMKSGRSSGLSQGVVTATDVTLQVSLNQTETAVFSKQVVAEMASQGGDSGSLVVDEQKRAVGLLFAGSEKFTVFNNIDLVLELLDVTL